jgi:hypothetical protein
MHRHTHLGNCPFWGIICQPHSLQKTGPGLVPGPEEEKIQPLPRQCLPIYMARSVIILPILGFFVPSLPVSSFLDRFRRFFEVVINAIAVAVDEAIPIPALMRLFGLLRPGVLRTPVRLLLGWGDCFFRSRCLSIRRGNLPAGSRRLLFRSRSLPVGDRSLLIGNLGLLLLGLLIIRLGHSSYCKGRPCRQKRRYHQ